MVYVTLALLLSATVSTLFLTIPGAFLVWVIALAYAGFTQSVGTHATFYLLTGLLACGTMLVETLAARNAVRPFRASFPGAIGAVIGGLIGAFFGIVPSFTVGPILGALVGELVSGSDTKYIVEVDRYRIVGSYAVTFLRLGVALIILGGWMSRELP